VAICDNLFRCLSRRWLEALVMDDSGNWFSLVEHPR
jgi:hypothetical protein